MGRKRKYTTEHIEKVKQLINTDQLTKADAIKQAGFSDSSLFYLTLKHYKLVEKVDYVTKKISFY